jgi:glycosyltransferase involved in cell wall biosynthesis
MLEYFVRVPELQVDLVTSALGSRFEVEYFSDQIKLYKVPVRNRNIHHSSNRELIEYAVRAFWCALKLHRKQSYDLCFAWSAVPAGAIALLLRRIAGLRYLLRVCGPDIPGFERRYRTVYRFLSPGIRRIWRGAEPVVVKSSREIQLIHAVEPHLNCLLIPNGVDAAAFRSSQTVTEAGPLRIVCVGRLIERKGQHHLIEAVKRLADEKIHVSLELVGAGDARSANEAHVERLGLTDRVRFLGYVPRETIAEHYAAAHVFVLPSYNEGMSVALLEAMASRLAVVATPNAGTPELIDPEVNGLVFDWGDVDRLAAHLRRLAQDRTLVRRMGEASRRRAEEFSWERSAVRYVELLKHLAADISLASANLEAEAKHKV